MSRIQEAIEEARESRANRDIFHGGKAGLPGGPKHHPGATALMASRVAILDYDTMAKSCIVAAIDDPVASTAYKMLRTRVRQRLEHNHWQTLAISSTAPDEGKTLTAINLAISLARMETTEVILIDFDLRRPSLHKYLGFAPDWSLSDYLDGSATIDQILYRTDLGNLTVLPNIRSFENSSELLSSPAIATLIATLRPAAEKHRFLLFDLPPILSSDDLLAFSSQTDAVLLVARERKTEREAIARVGELLADINVLGVVLNDSQEKSPTAPYYY